MIRIHNTDDNVTFISTLSKQEIQSIIRQLYLEDAVINTGNTFKTDNNTYKVIVNNLK